MTYELQVVYEGFDPEFDKKIEKLIGQNRVASGCGFGQRDIEFEFSYKSDAKEAGLKLKKLLGTNGLEVSVMEYPDEFDEFDEAESIF